MPLRIILGRTDKLWAISTWVPLVEGCTGGGYYRPHTSRLHMHACTTGSRVPCYRGNREILGTKWISHSPHLKHHQVAWNAQSCLLQIWQESEVRPKACVVKCKGGWYTEHPLLTLGIYNVGFWSRGLWVLPRVYGKLGWNNASPGHTSGQPPLETQNLGNP